MLPGMSAALPEAAGELPGGIETLRWTGGFPNIPDTSGPPPVATEVPGSWVYDFDPANSIARATFNGEIVYSGSSGTVTSFNGRGGVVTLTAADVTGAGGVVNPNAALTGAPTAPTAPAGTNTTQIATTAFVQGGYLPIPGGALTGPVDPWLIQASGPTTIAGNNFPTRGVNEQYSMAGNAPGVHGALWNFNLTDTLAVGAGTWYVPFYVADTFDASVGSGNRQPLVCAQTVNNGVGNSFYVGAQFNATLNSGVGACLGINPYVLIAAAAGTGAEAVSAEFDLDVRANVTRKIGVQIVDIATSTGTGTIGLDAGLMIARGSGAAGWVNGIQFGEQISNSPVAGSNGVKSTGTVLKVWPGSGVTGQADFTNGIDFTGLSILNNAFASPGFAVNGQGIISFGGSGAELYADTTNIHGNLPTGNGAFEWGLNNGNVIATLTAAGIFNPLSGYATQHGSTGGLDPGHVFNMSWGSGPMHLWVDNLDLGAIQVTPSDLRLKDNIQEISVDCLAAIKAIELRAYDMKETALTPEKHEPVGFIAQQLAEVIPEAVNAEPDPERMLSVQLMPLVAYLIGAVQQLSERLDALGA